MSSTVRLPTVEAGKGEAREAVATAVVARGRAATAVVAREAGSMEVQV